MGLVGLDIKTAKEVLYNLNNHNYEILYKDSKDKHGIVVDEKLDNSGKLIIFVGTRSIIKNLPSNFQRNETLKNFLMIFQHFNNDFDNTLNNIHDFFNPMATDKKFLFWLSSWFSLELGSDLPEQNYRRLIKEIVSLYQWRGTKYGLQRLLEIISGYKPEIYEGSFGLVSDISDSIDFIFTEAGDSVSEIGIHFPVSQKKLGGNVVKTIFKIVEKEKPAHINCRIGFTPDDIDTKIDRFTIGEMSLEENSRL